MSSIYELIYGRAAGAAGGSGDDGHGGSDAGGGSGIGACGSVKVLVHDVSEPPSHGVAP